MNGNSNIMPSDSESDTAANSMAYKRLHSKLLIVEKLQYKLQLLQKQNQQGKSAIDEEYSRTFDELQNNAGSILSVLRQSYELNSEDKGFYEDRMSDDDKGDGEVHDLKKLISMLQYLNDIKLDFDDNYSTNGSESIESDNELMENDEQLQQRKDLNREQEVEYYIKSNQNDLNLNKVFELQILNQQTISKINEKLKQINALQGKINEKKDRNINDRGTDENDNDFIKRVKVRSTVLSELITFMITSSGINWSKDESLAEMIRYCGDQYILDEKR